MSARLHVISGCSGGGKSTLIAALAKAGHATMPEPGRRIIQDDGPLPWDDPAGFARRAVDMAVADHAAATEAGQHCFFDRGVIDAAAALAEATGAPLDRPLIDRHPYASTVFLVPPWPEIHRPDAERRHGFAEAVAEHERLAALYPALGYTVVMLARAPVAERVALVLQYSA